MRFDDIVAAAEQPTNRALEAMLRDAVPWTDEESADDAIFAVADAGNADAVELVFRSGARPRTAEELWVRCATSKREPSEKVARLRSLGLENIEGALAWYADDTLNDCNGDFTAATRVLLEAGADVNARVETGGWTPLIIAVAVRDVAWVKLLLAAGPDIELAALDTNHPFYDDYPVGKGMTAFEYVKRMQRREPHHKAWPEIFALLETARASRGGAKTPSKRAKTAHGGRSFSVRSYKEALAVFEELDGAKACTVEPDIRLDAVPVGKVSASASVFSTGDVEEISEDVPTPLFYVVEYKNEEIQKWREAQEELFSDIARFMSSMPYGGVLGVWNADGQADVARLGADVPGFVASVEIEDQTLAVSFLLATWPVSEGFAFAVLRPEDQELLLRMVGLGKWPTRSKTVEVSYGE